MHSAPAGMNEFNLMIYTWHYCIYCFGHKQVGLICYAQLRMLFYELNMPFECAGAAGKTIWSLRPEQDGPAEAG